MIFNTNAQRECNQRNVHLFVICLKTILEITIMQLCLQKGQCLMPSSNFLIDNEKRAFIVVFDSKSPCDEVLKRQFSCENLDQLWNGSRDLCKYFQELNALRHNSNKSFKPTTKIYFKQQLIMIESNNYRLFIHFQRTKIAKK